MATLMHRAGKSSLLKLNPIFTTRIKDKEQNSTDWPEIQHPLSQTFSRILKVFIFCYIFFSHVYIRERFLAWEITPAEPEKVTQRFFPGPVMATTMNDCEWNINLGASFPLQVIIFGSTVRQLLSIHYLSTHNVTELNPDTRFQIHFEGQQPEKRKERNSQYVRQSNDQCRYLLLFQNHHHPTICW